MSNNIAIELELYKAALIEQGKSDNTIKNNLSQVKKYLETGLDIEAYKDYLLNKDVTNARGQVNKMKPSTVNTIINIIKSYNKVKGIESDTKLVKVQKQSFLNDVLSENDLERILRQVKKNNDLRAETLFLFLARTGCRISEALSIEKKQLKKLKKKGDIITVKGKGDKTRDIILTKEVIKLVNDYMTNDPYVDKSEKLFTSKYGAYARQSAHNDLKKYTGLARIKKEKGHLHNLRHLFCINAIESGLDISDVAQIVGHTDINTTTIYTKKSASTMLSILNKMK